VIGNDVVDLVLAKKESNWQRKGFLDKIFTKNEQVLIHKALDPEIMVWNLWSRKEAAYKIYNRETGIRGYFPLQLECDCSDYKTGTVRIKGLVYYTETTIDSDCIYTIAVAQNIIFNQIKTIPLDTLIEKINGIPFLKEEETQLLKPVSISHHGRFWRGISV
jgi:phosphopantetheinyl transferase (holo-ACP synthase)